MTDTHHHQEAKHEMSASPTPYQMRIGDQWSEARDGARFTTTNSYTGEPWASVPDAGAQDVDRAVRAATAALEGAWGRCTGFERARHMRRLSDILERDAAELAELETTDNGKLLRETSVQTAALPEWLRYFAGVADKLQGDVIPAQNPEFLIYTRHEPVGVVGAIVPWNSPLSLLMWKLAPLLAAGCTAVVKPSEETPVTALELAKRVEEAGLPAGVFTSSPAATAAGSALSSSAILGSVRWRSPARPASG